jgi:flagellar assembly protein FliH
MTIIREPQSLKEANQRAVVLDLGDLAARGKHLREIAVREANDLLVKAQAEREKLLRSATTLGNAAGHKEGYAKGYAEGIEAGRALALAQGAKDVALLEQTLTTALDQFNAAREDLLSSASADIINVAIEVTARLTARVFEEVPSTVTALLESALPLVLKPSRLRVYVHPDDAQLIAQTLPGVQQRFAMVQHIEVIADPDSQRGTCRVMNDRGGMIDASVNTQLDRVAAELCYDRSKSRVAPSSDTVISGTGGAS